MKTRKSTPHARGAKRKNASGRPWYTRLIVPAHLKQAGAYKEKGVPIKNGIYRVRIMVHKLGNRTVVAVEVRDCVNLV